MCSLDEIGSASMSSSPSSPEAKPWIWSRRLSASTSQSRSGRASEPTMFNGIPALEPGV